MLWNREDAEDATQEILVRTVTRLAQFDFRSKLKTWVYRIAVNYKQREGLGDRAHGVLRQQRGEPDGLVAQLAADCLLRMRRQITLVEQQILGASLGTPRLSCVGVR